MEMNSKVSAKQIVYLDQSFNSYEYFLTGNDKNLRSGKNPLELKLRGSTSKTNQNSPSRGDGGSFLDKLQTLN